MASTSTTTSSSHAVTTTSATMASTVSLTASVSTQVSTTTTTPATVAATITAAPAPRRRGRPAKSATANIAPAVAKTPVQPLVLRECQRSHFQRLLTILATEPAYLDTSDMGAGKTILTLAVALKNSLPIIVVCPLTAKAMWAAEAAKYGVELLYIITYQSLRGTAKSQPNHPYLNRQEDMFYPTEHYIKMAQAGLLLVFDEVHNLKNENSQLAAAHTLVRTLRTWNCPSRVALLSATPCDKESGAESIFKMLGIINHDKLYEYDRSNKQYEDLGLAEVLAKAMVVNERKTHQLINELYPLDKKTYPTMCFRLYTDVLKTYLTSAMPRDATAVAAADYFKDIKNGFYLMNEEDATRLGDGVDELAAAAGFNGSDINRDRDAFGAVGRIMVNIESAKVRTFARLAHHKLRRSRHVKVVLALNYNASIDKLMMILARYRPLRLDGSVPEKHRSDVVARFQRADSDYQLLIMNPAVGGVAISLDDTDGRFPRYMFVSPSYFFIQMHQVGGRVVRANTKSRAVIRFVYGANSSGEASLLNALAQKSSVAHDMTWDRSIKFPGEYSSYEEKKRPVETTPRSLFQQVAEFIVETDVKYVPGITISRDIHELIEVVARDLGFRYQPEILSLKG